MASALCSRVAKRAVAKVVKSASTTSTTTKTTTATKLSSTSSSVPSRRLRLSQLSGRIGCVESLLPLHSAVAAARMTSCLTSTSQNCRSLAQGT